MYTYKCYFHPKSDSDQPCRGCKLPICVECTGGEGFCPECAQRRAVVHDLRQLRSAMAAHAHVASTTGRLRLARRQMIENRSPSRVLSPSGALRAPMPPMAATRPLNDVYSPAERGPAPQPRRYNPDVAYRPPAELPRKKRPAPKAKKAAAPKAAAPAFPLVPFLIGLGIGVAVMVGALVLKPLLRAPAHHAKAPAYSALSPEFRAELRRNANVEFVEIADAPEPVSNRHAAPARAHSTRHVPRAWHATAPVRHARKHQPTLAEAMKFTREPESAM